MRIERGNDGSKFMLFIMVWAIAFVFALMFVVGIIGEIVDLDLIDMVFDALSSPWGTIAYQIIIFILPLVIWMAIKKESWKPNFPAAKLGKKNIIILIALSFLLQPLMMLISAISAQFFTNDVAELMYSFQRHPFWLQMLSIAVTPAICEELVFRGYIQSKYREHTIRKAALINGFFFAMMHLNLQQFAYTFVLGVIFAYMVHYTRSIWAGIIPHFIVNGTQVSLGRLVFSMDAPDMPAYAEIYVAPNISYEVQGIIVLGIMTLVLSPAIFLLFREFIMHNKWLVAIEKVREQSAQQQMQVQPQASEYENGNIYQPDSSINVNAMPDWASPISDAAPAPEWEGTPANEWESTHSAIPQMQQNEPVEPSKIDPYAIGVVIVFVLFAVLVLLS